MPALDEVRPTGRPGEYGLARLRNSLSDLDLVVVLFAVELAGVYVFASTVDEVIPRVGLVAVIPIVGVVAVIPLAPNIGAVEAERLGAVRLFQSGANLMEFAVNIPNWIFDQAFELRGDLVLVIDIHDPLEGVRVNEMQQSLPLCARRVLVVAEHGAPQVQIHHRSP